MKYHSDYYSIKAYHIAHESKTTFLLNLDMACEKPELRMVVHLLASSKQNNNVLHILKSTKMYQQTTMATNKHETFQIFIQNTTLERLLLTYVL